MANDAMNEQSETIVGDDDIAVGLSKKKINGKLIVMAAGALVVLIALILGVVSFFSGGHEDQKAHDPIEGKIDELAHGAAENADAHQREADKPAEELKLLFFDLGEQTHNLNTNGDGASFLRLRVILELDRQSYYDEIQAKTPRVLDELSVYLRELRPSDLEGGAGILRLKEELLIRINQAVAPARVKDVLLQDFIVQGV